MGMYANKRGRGAPDTRLASTKPPSLQQVLQAGLAQFAGSSSPSYSRYRYPSESSFTALCRFVHEG